MRRFWWHDRICYAFLVISKTKKLRKFTWQREKKLCLMDSNQQKCKWENLWTELKLPAGVSFCGTNFVQTRVNFCVSQIFLWVIRNSSNLSVYYKCALFLRKENKKSFICLVMGVLRNALILHTCSLSSLSIYLTVLKRMKWKVCGYAVLLVVSSSFPSFVNNLIKCSPLPTFKHFQHLKNS